MKSRVELLRFLHSDLKPLVHAMRRESLEKIARLEKALWLSILAILLSYALLFINDTIALFYLFLFASHVAFILYLNDRISLNEQDLSDFRKEVISRLVAFSGPGLGYYPKRHISAQTISESGLLPAFGAELLGSNLIVGDINGVRVEFSDIWTKRFDGTFFTARFNKAFTGRIAILPDSAENLFGTLIGRWLQRHNMSQADLIAMDHPAFERLFVVYGTDEIETRYILTPAMMERIVFFQNRVKSPVRIYFFSGRMHLAFNYRPSLRSKDDGTVISLEQSRRFIETFSFMTALTADFKLNQKLWSKN
jgi:hypothetical protein